MQKLSPLLQSLQRKHKDDPQQLNREMMDLYRAHGVNPLSGCLPMVLQMPILFALYNVLSRPETFVAVQGGQPLKKIPFMVWDLLTHPMTPVSDVGVHGLASAVAYGLVPLLIAGSTWLQQKVSVTDPNQARMMMFMPILIGYFSLNFPVGLSLYWFTSTMAYVAEYLAVVGFPGAIAKPEPAPPEPSAKARERSHSSPAGPRRKPKRG
jgi:YidC/Oxa1 family membrane protein insertase